MYYSGIIPEDVVNGLGCRVSIFISGCDNKCEDCFNKELWDYNYGKKFSNFTFNDIVKYVRNPLIKGITLLGGDPLSERNAQDVLKFILRYKKYVHKHEDNGYKDKDNIWIYSGYTYEELMNRDSITREILQNCDVLVDGPFIKDLKDLSLKFRGSSNQRVIDLKQSIFSNKIILLDLGENISITSVSKEKKTDLNNFSEFVQNSFNTVKIVVEKIIKKIFPSSTNY